MENAWPQLPVNEGVQSNCWKPVLIFGILYYFIYIIVYIAEGLWVNEEMVEIKGGPCQWCADWNDRTDWKRYLSATWCFSSQIYKHEIVSIETRTAHYWPDWFPRYYCNPVMWCCCHKSYSGWYFPLCCNDVNVAGLCDGDVGPVTELRYVQFNLSESPTACLCPQRCTPNIWSGCTYNRISYVLRDPSVVDQLKQSGYTVLEPVGAGGVGGAPATQATGATDTQTGGPAVTSQPATADASAPPDTEGGATA